MKRPNRLFLGTAIALLSPLVAGCSAKTSNRSNEALVQPKVEPANQNDVANSRSFLDDSEVQKWMIVNDGVMGGKSLSKLRALPSGASFAGVLSPENNGGFASIRTGLKHAPPTGLQSIAIRVRGDGNRYQFRVRTSPRFDGPAYVHTFETTPNAWQEVILPLRDFRASFRGRAVPATKPLVSEDMRQWGFLIADKQFGSFELEIENIKLL